MSQFLDFPSLKLQTGHDMTAIHSLSQAFRSDSTKADETFKAASVIATASPIIGQSAGIRRAVDLAARIAQTDLPILLVGETGTGKEIFAQQIHRWSGRSGPMVDVNCAALPREMVESLLFGHKRGSFTGAIDNTGGLIEEADRGTLFLDELLSMPLEAQAKLLRVLESGEVRRVGETVKRRIRVRAIATVQEDVGQRLADQRFRADLLQRLAGAVIELPSLLNREDDVLVLAAHFARARGRSLGPGALSVLRGHTWPGNVRELRLAIERASALSDAEVLSARTLAEAIAVGASLIGLQSLQTSPNQGTGSRLRDRVLATFAANGCNAARTAQALGVGRTTLFKQLKALGISLRDERVSLTIRARTG